MYVVNAEFLEEGKFHLIFALCPGYPAADIHGGGIDHPHECVLGPSIDEPGL